MYLNILINSTPTKDFLS